MDLTKLVAVVEKNPRGVIALAQLIVDPMVEDQSILVDATHALSGGTAGELAFAAKHPLYTARVMKAAVDLFTDDADQLTALLDAFRAS